jgi:hypothetical protein
MSAGGVSHFSSSAAINGKLTPAPIITGSVRNTSHASTLSSISPASFNNTSGFFPALDDNSPTAKHQITGQFTDFLRNVFPAVDGVIKELGSHPKAHMGALGNLLYEHILSVREILNCYQLNALSETAIESLRGRVGTIKQELDIAASSARIKIKGTLEIQTPDGWVSRTVTLTLNDLLSSDAKGARQIDCRLIQSVEEIHNAKDSEFSIKLVGGRSIHFRAANDAERQKWLNYLRLYERQYHVESCLTAMSIKDRIKLYQSVVFTPFQADQDSSPNSFSRRKPQFPGQKQTAEFLFNTVAEEAKLLGGQSRSAGVAGDKNKRTNRNGAPMKRRSSIVALGKKSLAGFGGMSERFDVQMKQSLGRDKARELQIDLGRPHRFLMYKQGNSDPDLICFRQDLVDFRINIKGFSLEICFRSAAGKEQRKFIFNSIQSTSRFHELLLLFQTSSDMDIYQFAYQDVLLLIDHFGYQIPKK